MHLRSSLVLAILVLAIAARADETIDEEQIEYATVEGCGKCQLNRFPQVKKFIYEDVPLYDNVKYVLVPNAFPTIVYRNKHGQEIDRVYIRYMNQKECNDLLREKGFKKNKKPEPVSQKRPAPFVENPENEETHDPEPEEQEQDPVIDQSKEEL